MNPDYRYNFEIKEGDPVAYQPDKITLSLKPHQLASLHKAILFERHGSVNYYIENPEEFLNAGLDRRYYEPKIAIYRKNYRVYTNIGVLGDLVGYGKTLVSLSMIASTPTRDIYTNSNIVYSYNGYISKGNIRIECETVENITETRSLFETTLVIVPRGPVYVQWNTSLEKNTRLNYIAINDLSYIKKHCPPQGSSHEELKNYFEKYEVVLIKNTTLPTFLNYYNNNPYQPSPIKGFARIMIDEAPDYLSKIPLLEYRFIWLISATYMQLLHSPYRGNGIGTVVKELLSPERMYTVLVKCNTEFTMKSFIVPPFNEIIYKCTAPRYIEILQPFLTNSIMQMVNANDISGAIRELGGTADTEDNIVELVSKNLMREIFNKEKEKDYIEGLDIDAHTKQNKVKTINEELEKLEKKKKDLEERILTITKDTCSICYNDLETPVLLSCTHIFCGQCIMKWIEVNQISYQTNRVCPTCRTPINKNELIAIVKNKKDRVKKINEIRHLTKIETIMDIITKTPDGRFLIFSQFDTTFHEIRDELDKYVVSNCELKGTTNMMMQHLDNFKKGETRVILLNAHYAGSGIDISSATDVILFHHMGDMSKQAIGRAQRVGRTDTLRVHRLYYPNEEIML